MRKLTLILILFFNYSFTQSYNSGYEKGYKEGFCYEDYGCIVPVSPNPPIPAIGYDSFQDGYNRGF